MSTVLGVLSAAHFFASAVCLQKINKRCVVFFFGLNGAGVRHANASQRPKAGQ